jgi:hypothetical protein
MADGMDLVELRDAVEKAIQGLTAYRARGTIQRKNND